MSFDKTGEAIKDDSVAYAEAFLLEYTKTIDGYWNELVTEIDDRGLPLQSYLPLYRKELGITVSISIFSADSVFWLFFLRPVKGKVNSIDIALNDARFGIDWFQKSPVEVRRQTILSRLGIAPNEILSELFIAGGDPFVLFRRDYIVSQASIHGGDYAVRDARQATVLLSSGDAKRMPHIFISYRHVDSQHTTGRLYDHLIKEFSEYQVFRDVRSIGPGETFDSVCESAVNGCKVLIAIIGKQWLTVADKHGSRRLDNPQDLVRREVATALQRDILVIPLLVDSATMPNGSELSDDLKPLMQRNIHELRDKDFDHDLRKLIKAINRTFPIEERLRSARWEGKITYEQEMFVRNSPSEIRENTFDDLLDTAAARTRVREEDRTKTVKDLLEALQQSENTALRITCVLLTRQGNDIDLVIECPVVLPRSSAWSELSAKGWNKNASGRYAKHYHLDNSSEDAYKFQLLTVTEEIIAANKFAGAPVERLFVTYVEE